MSLIRGTATMADYRLGDVIATIKQFLEVASADGWEFSADDCKELIPTRLAELGPSAFPKVLKKFVDNDELDLLQRFVEIIINGFATRWWA